MLAGKSQARYDDRRTARLQDLNGSMFSQFNLTLLPLIAGSTTSLLVCLLLVYTKDWHGHLTLDGACGVQKFHLHPTPRIGGLGVMLGLSVAWGLSPPDISRILGPMLVASIPAFAFGIAEDLSKRVGIRERLLATMASGVLAWWLTGVSLTHSNIWGLDFLLTWLPFSVLFTAFAVGGIANSINIIDGFNGLAAGVIIICLSALGLMAYLAGDTELFQISLLLCAVTVGFLMVNFPFGKIFLGDGGAYLLGFLLGWVDLLLPMRNPEISAWASMLACAYPVLEVFFSMARRHRRSLHVGHPDRLHLHSLIKCRISRHRLAHWPPALRNSAVSPMIWCFALVPATLAVLFRNNTAMLIVSFFLCGLLYATLYARLIYFRWKLPRF